MKQITAKYGILLKNGKCYLFENGTVNIFDSECDVFPFETEEERANYIATNNLVVESYNNKLVI